MVSYSLDLVTDTYGDRGCEVAVLGGDRGFKGDTRRRQVLCTAVLSGDRGFSVCSRRRNTLQERHSAETEASAGSVGTPTSMASWIRNARTNNAGMFSPGNDSGVA
ncbi:hypothetical protein PIB30_064143, partial [Stylosanthes scabra]|nr:hypothetical protein [Stylosanthes scabra]